MNKSLVAVGVIVALGVVWTGGAKGDFFILLLVIQWLERNIGTGITAVTNARVNLKRRFTFCHIKQWFAYFVINQRGLN